MKTSGIRTDRSCHYNKNAPQLIAYIAKTIISWICACATARYMQIQPEPIVRLLVFCVLLLLSTKYFDKCLRLEKLPIPTKGRLTVLLTMALFSFALACSIILGYHIVISGHPSNGRVNDNYISNYSWLDLPAFFLIWLTFFVLAIAAFSLLTRAVAKTSESEPYKIPGRPICKIVILSLIILIMWLPYLLIYWPAIVLSDSTWSIIQALGWDGLNNHHPILYTLFIKLCLDFGQLLGVGTTGGLVIYSILQMASLSLCLSYSLYWLCRWSKIGYIVALGVAVVFGGSPYFATYSIAMWKDPFFAMALLLLTIQLGNFILANVSKEKTSFSGSLLSLFILAACFTRNNGIYICLIVFIGVIAFTLINKLIRRQKKLTLKVIASSLVPLLLVPVVTGPLYDGLGIEKTPKAESYGLFLNQMSRVAALDGKMSDEDKSYLNSLLPIDEYASVYCPTKADAIKWNESFDAGKLEEGFLSHYLSLMIKNPKLYFEAWELETFGFWAINVPLINNNASNISSGGDPMNITDLESYIKAMNDAGISFDNKLGFGNSWFVLNEWSVPLGWIFWLSLFMVAYLFLTRQSKWLLMLLPMLGLYLTLFAATPMYYWPRYGVFAHFGFPILAALPFISHQAECCNRTDN
jgi:hypothetical protein